MTNNQTEHDWFNEQIATALAGGLSETERSRFDSHAKDCSPCAAALAEAKAADHTVAGFLADLQPPEGLEDRIVGRLRAQRRFDHPLLIRTATAAAAAILVGSAGWVGTRFLQPPTKLADTRSVNSQVFQNQLPDSSDRSKYKNLGRAVPLAGAADEPAITEFSAANPGSAVIQVLPGAPAATDTPSAEPMMPPPQTSEAAKSVPDEIAVRGLGDRSTVGPADGRDASGSINRGGFAGGFGGGGGGFGGGGGGGFAGFLQPQRGGGGGGRGLALLDTQTAKDQLAAQTANAPAADSAPPIEINPTTQPAALSDRKIIRSGEMKFEVESFDAADHRLRDIVRQCGGYVGSADSQRLPNGKVQGTLTVRVPPENLDTLVLGLRALGDLQEQQIGAQDITKEYTDLQSELRAARAMEDRLLEIIHTANAQVKDLLAVEKELGTWREKIEQVTGQINYYNNLVSLSTLTITLSEKDIDQAATATETETINTGLEADDVSRARDEVIKAVEAAKGRIIQSDLNEQQAGQFTATVVALLPADAGGPIIDRLRQLGRITRLESNRRQTINGQPAPENVKVNRRDTQLQLSIFNVDAYSPRSTDNLSLACGDVESAYHSIMDFLNRSDRARVIDSNLNRPTPDTTSGVISFEIRENSADATLAFLRSLGTSLQFTVAENRDADSVTSSKRGFNVTLMPLAGIAAQETDDMTILPLNADLLATYNALLDLANQPDVKARIVDKDLQQTNGVFVSATIAMEVGRDKLDAAEQKIAAAGKIVARKADRQPDSPNVIDTKLLLRFSFVNVDALEPRQTFVRELAADDASAAYQSILDAARASGAKIRSADLQVQPGQNTTGQLEFDLPADKQPALQQTLDHATTLIGQTTNRAAEGDATTESKVRYRLTVYQTDQLAPRRSFTMEIQTPRAESAAADVTTAALSAGGQVLEHSTRTEPDGGAVTRLVLTAPLAKADSIAASASSAGTLLKDESVENAQAPSGPAARARLEIEFNTEAGVVADNNGLFAAIKQGLTTSIRGLLWSIQLLVIGLCLIVPWLLAGWAGWKYFRRSPRSRQR
jgi:uncharacterized protein DUF4349